MFTSVCLSVRLPLALAKLIWDLHSFLTVLDSENLSYIAQAQKKSISELLSKLQSSDAPGENKAWFLHQNQTNWWPLGPEPELGYSQD